MVKKLALILVLLAATATAQTSPPLVKVPDLTSAPHFVVDGILALQQKGFVVALAAREDLANRPGYIIDQAPDGFASRAKGSVIRLTVATRATANLALSDEEAKRLPAETAERLRKQFTEDAEVLVPQVEGLRAIDAMLALQQRGLKINLDVIHIGTHVLDDLRALTVASQDRRADSTAPAGTSVEIKCLGKELDASPEELARLTHENQTVLRHAREALGRVRPGEGR